MATGNILKNALFALAVATSATGCMDILEQAPINALSDKVIFTDAKRAESALFGVYDGVQNNQFYAGRVQLYGDIMSDPFHNVTNNGVTALGVYRLNMVANSTEVEGVWTAAYQAIGRANTLLKGLDDSPGVLPTAKEAQFRAEARFLRALSYFTLMTFYTKPYNLATNVNTELGVIIYTKPETGTPQPTPRSSIKACYDFILDDLNYAVDNLLLSQGAADASAQRATKDAARALRMRVYMSMNRWDDVILDGQVLAPVPVAPLTNFVSPGGRTLLEKVEAIPTYNSETLFSIPHTSNDNPNTQNHLPGFFLTGSGDYRVSTALVDTTIWEATDFRKTVLLETVTVGTTKQYWLKKFPNANPPINWAPVLRYPEVLLNYAEALVRQTGVVNPLSIQLLNGVRKRAGATLFTAADFADADAFLKALLFEKKIEHMGEGLQIYDIRRLGLDFNSKPDPLGGGTDRIAPTSTRYFWPIANSEITRNAACQQNPQ